jgi:exonuclease VII small subunit
MKRNLKAELEKELKGLEMKVEKLNTFLEKRFDGKTGITDVDVYSAMVTHRIAIKEYKNTLEYIITSLENGENREDEEGNNG